MRYVRQLRTKPNSASAAAPSQKNKWMRVTHPTLEVPGDPVREVWLGVSRLQLRERTSDVVRLVQVREQLLVVKVCLVHVEVRQNIVVGQMAILLPSDVMRPEERDAFRTAGEVSTSNEKS